MKTKITKQGMRNGILGVALSLFGFAANAQQVTADIVKQPAATLGKIGTGLGDGGSIRVIDNKGTIKFLQAKNGITQITNTAPNGGVVTTWQLGGKFEDDVTLDVNGKYLKFASVLQNTDTKATASGAVTTLATQATIGTSGLILLMRDEATGTMVKVLASDLVKGGQMKVAATADGTAPALTETTIPGDYTKVWVYRNGAKLVANDDYTVAAGVVTLSADADVADPDHWQIFSGDVFEVQWIR